MWHSSLPNQYLNLSLLGSFQSCHSPHPHLPNICQSCRRLQVHLPWQAKRFGGPVHFNILKRLHNCHAFNEVTPVAFRKALNTILSDTLPGHCGFFSNGLLSASATVTIKQLQFLDAAEQEWVFSSDSGQVSTFPGSFEHKAVHISDVIKFTIGKGGRSVSGIRKRNK